MLVEFFCCGVMVGEMVKISKVVRPLQWFLFMRSASSFAQRFFLGKASACLEFPCSVGGHLGFKDFCLHAEK